MTFLPGWIRETRRAGVPDRSGIRAWPEPGALPNVCHAERTMSPGPVSRARAIVISPHLVSPHDAPDHRPAACPLLAGKVRVLNR
jgi:hypothetical protein